MIAAIVIGLLAVAVAAFVLGPLFRPDARDAERVANALSTEQDLSTRHAMAVAALRDLEEDRQTGKVGDADYESMRAKLEERAIALMRSLDELAASRR